MDNRTFAGLLAATPPADLSIIELTAELTRPDGSFDLDAAAARQSGGGAGLRPGAGLRRGHGPPAGGAEMAAAAPAQLSGLAKLLLRRPPSLRELVTLVGYADDYAWFAGLVRRLFPRGGGGGAGGPRRTHEGGALRPALRGAALPPLRSVLRVLHGRGGRTSLDLAAEGHPLRADGLRLRRPPRDVGRLPRGLSALALLAKPPDSFYEEPDGMRVAWLESAAARIPQETLLRIPQGGIPLDDLTEALKGTGSRGRRRPAPGSSPRPATSSSTTPTTTACTTASPTPGRTTSSRRARRSGARPAPSWTR